VKIERTHPHKLPYPVARARAESIAIEMSAAYGVAWYWEASTIHFTGSGVSKGVTGFLVVAKDHARIVLELPMLLWGLKTVIDASVREYLAQLD